MTAGIRSRGSTFRSRERPLGRKDSAAVRLGNLLCARALVLLVLCACKGVWWVLEQPMTSTMEYHPLFQKVIKLLGMRRLLVSMARFGGPTDKKTWLYSSISVAFFGMVAILFVFCKPTNFSGSFNFHGMLRCLQYSFWRLVHMFCPRPWGDRPSQGL